MAKYKSTSTLFKMDILCWRRCVSSYVGHLEWDVTPFKLNHTFVVLVSKKHKLYSMGNFRPISLCNVVYKLVIKSIRTRSWLWRSFLANTREFRVMDGTELPNVSTSGRCFRTINTWGYQQWWESHKRSPSYLSLITSKSVSAAGWTNSFG